MKRRCTYCGLKLKGKKLNKHVEEVHEGGGVEFYCRESCVRCCTDEGAPLELSLEDIKRISKHLDITTETFFNKYGGVLWSNIPGTHMLIPSTGLPFPCGFLEDGKCSIYEVRPLHCRLFPERLFVDPSPQDYRSFHRAGYECVDEGFSLGDERRKELKKLMEKDHQELVDTAEFFENENLIYELKPAQHRRLQDLFSRIPLDDPERNRKRREALESIIPPEFKKRVLKAFLLRLQALDTRLK